MPDNSRRDFIKKTALASIAATAFSGIETLTANNLKTTGKKELLNFLFQGDSITDGNRGRNKDPNHIMGHGYAFSIASRGEKRLQKRIIFSTTGVSVEIKLLI